MEKKKYYHYLLEEINGEQEYAYDYLIEAESLKQAEAIANTHANTFYCDEAEEVYDGSYMFFGGTISVEIKSITETTKEGFIENLLWKSILRAA